MASPLQVFPFLDLPFELRSAVYSYTLHWPNMSASPKLKEGCRKGIRSLSPSTPDLQKLSTPPVLLLNHRVLDEAIEVLYRKQLSLSNPVDITKCFGEATLQRVRNVVLDMDLNLDYNIPHNHGDANGWGTVVHRLLKIWHKKNSLKGVVVQGSYSPPSKSLGWGFREAAHHICVKNLLALVCLRLCIRPFSMIS